MNQASSVSRRAVLSAVLTGGTAGCLEPLRPSPSCTVTGGSFETDVVESMSSVGSSNTVRYDGSCDRWTQKTCFVISLTIDPDAIDVLEARTPDEGPVLRLDIEERELRVELTAVEPGESATFELSLLADGETIETTVVSLEC